MNRSFSTKGLSHSALADPLGKVRRTHRSHGLTLHTKVVKSLKETGQYENTIIVVTTDNGGAVKVGGNNMPLKGTKGTNGPYLD